MTQGSDVILERMMTLHPKVIDLTLARVERLLMALGHPERTLPAVIHIAGTNGKGSTRATRSTPIPRRIWRGSMNAFGWQAS
jgi:dihydrofolate synthase/folylpolyglutamate synthase